MKRNMNKKRLNCKILVCVNIIGYIMALIAIFIDIKFDLNSGALSNFASIMYPTVITVAGFLITVYILFLEIYKDRYPFEKLQRKHFTNTRYYLSAIIYNVIVGCAVICIGKGLISFVLFCITSLSTIVSIMFFVSKSNKSLMLTSYVEDFCNDINTEFNVNRSVVSVPTVQNIKNVLDECATKEEYHTVGVIVERTGDLFREFLKNSIAIASDEKNSNKSVVDTFDNIVALNIFELGLCKTIKSSQLMKKIVNQQYMNLRFCIENYQIEWYEKYFKEYLKYLYKIQNENLMEVANLIYRSFSGVIQCLYDNEKKDCAEKTVKDIDKANISLVCINKKGNSKAYTQFLAGAVDYAINEKNEKLLDLLIEIIGEYSYTLIKHSDSFVDIIEYYKWIFDSILKFNTEKAIMLYERCIDIFSYNGMQTSALIECNMFCLNRLIEKDQDEKKNQEKLMEYHIALLYQVGKAKEKYAGYLFFPDFESMIEENKGNVEQIKRISSYIKKIFNQCILGDNIPLFYEFINKINSIITKTKSQQRFIQEGIFSVYFWLINRTHQLVNKQFLEIAFFNLDMVIEELDNNKAISEALGEYIIDNLRECCKMNMFNNGDSSIEIISMLSDFLLKDNAYYFVVTKSKLRRLLYKTLFNIGTDCVENGFEEGVRGVSNSLGWLIIDSIKRNDDELTTYLIERVSELYSISITMEISHKTRMFMLTLFPTVGAYCCKSAGYSKYCNLIIDAIKEEPSINVETAVRLRTSENDMWNNLYEGKTDELTRKFMEKYRKKSGDSEVVKEAKKLIGIK